MKSKRSQFFIFSALFYILLFLFIYSLETENSYIVNSDKVNLLDNLVYETCQIGINSNASQIAQRFGNYTNDVRSYCIDFGYNCTLDIQLQAGMPPGGNFSLLNYTMYDYNISYRKSGFNYHGGFTC